MCIVFNLMLVCSVFTFFSNASHLPYGFSVPFASFTVYYREPGLTEDWFEDTVIPYEGQFYHEMIESKKIDPSRVYYVKDYSTQYYYERGKNDAGTVKVRQDSLYDLMLGEKTEINGKTYKVEQCAELNETDPNMVLPLSDVPAQTLCFSYYLENISDEEYDTVIKYFTDRGYIIDGAQSHYHTSLDILRNSIFSGTGYKAVRIIVLGCLCVCLCVNHIHHISAKEYRIHFRYGGTAWKIALQILKEYIPWILLSELVVIVYYLYAKAKDLASTHGWYPVWIPLSVTGVSLVFIIILMIVLFPWSDIREEI